MLCGTLSLHPSSESPFSSACLLHRFIFLCCLRRLCVVASFSRCASCGSYVAAPRARVPYFCLEPCPLPVVYPRPSHGKGSIGVRVRACMLPPPLPHSSTLPLPLPPAHAKRGAHRCPMHKPNVQRQLREEGTIHPLLAHVWRKKARHLPCSRALQPARALLASHAQWRSRRVLVSLTRVLRSGPQHCCVPRPPPLPLT